MLDDGEDVQARPGQGAGLEEITREQHIRLAAQEVGPGGVLSLGRGSDAASIKNLPDGGGGDLDPDPVDAPVAPRGVLTCQAQDQGTDRTDGALAPSPPWSTGSGVTVLQEVAVPVQDGVRPDQQVELPELVHRQAMEQSGEQEPVGWRERRLGR